MTDWYRVETTEQQERVASAWQGAPLANLEVLGMILDTAREQVIAYAPEPPAEDLAVVDGYVTPGYVVPARYVYAQLQQAINLWNAGRASGDGEVGAEGYTFTPRPLDRTIRQIIRPVNGKLDVY